MPDLAMCPSTVCSVRTQCMRSWDSKCYKPDRTFEEQPWVPFRILLGVSYGPTAHPSDCDWYKPVHPPTSILEDL